MRGLVKLILACMAIALLAPVAAFVWLYFDYTGLPDWQRLAQFAPDTPEQVSDPCLKADVPIVAYSYDAIGPTMRAALAAAEGGEDYPGILEELYLSLTRRTTPHTASTPVLSYMIAKTMFCQAQTGHTIRENLDALRLTIQLERHYSHRQLFTICANRVYFAEGQYGVEGASRHFFNKEPDQLRIEEAALLAGLPRAPGRYSPRWHPDVAIERRNKVIDRMIATHAITLADGKLAKAAPLTAIPTTPGIPDR